VLASVRSLAALVLTSVGAALIGVTPLGAQRSSGPRIEIRLPPVEALATQGPVVAAPEMLSDRRVQEALASGFPARLRFRVELWSTEGWFNSLMARTEWAVIVRKQPLDEGYEVLRAVEGEPPMSNGDYGTLEAAEEAVALGMLAPITPPRGGQRYYYNAVLEVEMLSVSDLDELERWLEGELGPAVRGERNPGTAFTRGLRTLFVRLLGGEQRRYEVRSPTFFVR
jgi:hypothetical protein